MFDKFSMENKYKAFLLVSLKSLDSSWIVETLYQASLFSNNNLSYIFRQTHAIISSPKCVHRRNFASDLNLMFRIKNNKNRLCDHSWPHGRP